MPTISNDKIYELINSTRLELKGDIGELRRSFQTLEEGRLTRLEGKVSDMEVTNTRQESQLKENQAVISTKLLVLFTIGYTILSALLTGLFSWLFKR